ncbi:MAG: class I tRNA ligase family protein, partial [Candidatus Nealsonbacteria bacterium]|nr:class I tRNA ligase family protein [Candidatus Nealsonbacteria bacterium]
LGQWMDWDNSYYTMSEENNYAIWAFLKKCHKLGYLYKGRDSVPWCPRCGTAISQHEMLTEEYKLITHKAVYLKFPITEGKFEGYSFLVWTTTPWTIPANVALVVNPDFEYGVYSKGKVILLKSLAEKTIGDEKLEKTVKGKELKGIRYEGPFDNLERVQKAKEENTKTFHTVVLDKDLVTELEGTGIVHCAPGAGEEDFKIGLKEKLSVIDVIDDAAFYLSGMSAFSGKNAKEHPELILDYLKDTKFFFKIEDYEHRYPTCWRCKKELVWRVVDEWYISMDKLRKPLMDIVKKVNWIPNFGLERELDWLKNMHDWLISKKRYWGLALPIFECKCGNFEVMGSKEELKERAVSGWDKFEGNSPHRPWVDEVKIKCSKCNEVVSRIKDVGNPWLDAGIVPFSTMGYFSDKKKWKEWFPAELVCESFPGQFKNWFYSILVMSAVLEGVSPTKTIFGFASVKDEKGEEMHKSKGNAIWFDEAVEKVGADPMRFMYARQNPTDNLKFGYHALDEIKRKILTLYNSYVFFNTYVDKKELPEKSIGSKNILDLWIVSKFNNLLLKAGTSLEKYDPMTATIAIEYFFNNDLSLWYIRRSRDRFHEGSEEKTEAIAAIYYILLNLAKITAPIMPFFSEEMYQMIKKDNMPESVHLYDWPEADKKLIDNDLEKEMDEVRNIVTLALAERALKGIKVRQPLQKLKVKNKKLKLGDELLDLIKDEVNIKEVVFDNKIEKGVELDTKLTEELKKEGLQRESVRTVKSLRKEINLTPQNYVSVSGSVTNIDIEEFKKETGATEYIIYPFDKVSGDAIKEIEVDGRKYKIGIKKVK